MTPGHHTYTATTSQVATYRIANALTCDASCSSGAWACGLHAQAAASSASCMHGSSWPHSAQPRGSTLPRPDRAPPAQWALCMAWPNCVKGGGGGGAPAAPDPAGLRCCCAVTRSLHTCRTPHPDHWSSPSWPHSFCRRTATYGSFKEAFPPSHHQRLGPPTLKRFHH